jgi:amino acid adenylation domain-containing protein
MFITPERARAAGPGPVQRRTWQPPGWAALCARYSNAGPGLLLCAALTVLLDRYGLPMRLLPGAGCGSASAARRYLALDRGNSSWVELLTAAAQGDADSRDSAGSRDNTGSEEAAPRSEFIVWAGADVPPSGTADLSFSATEGELQAEWDSAVFQPETVSAIAAHLGRLADQLARPEPPRLVDLEILTSAELKINGGSPAELPDYPQVTLHQLFQLQAWRTPNASALAMGGRTMSYRELDQASNLLAHRLLATGAAPGAVIAVGGERCFGLFTALLGVLKAGGVFVYLDPAYPVSRLRECVEVCRPHAVLLGPGAVDLGDGQPTLKLAAVPDLSEPGPRTAPGILVGAESPAYILFTSGSTGTPKGVLRPHRLHTSRVFLEQSLYEVGPQDRHLLKLPISAREFFWPLATGGTAVIAEPGGERDDRYLVDLLRTERISVLSCVPSMLRVMAAIPGFADLPALRHIFVGGETLHCDLEEQVRSLGYAVHNTYTLTEADYVAHRRDPVSEWTDASVIGAPLDMRVYLCDETGRRVPPGLAGELWVGGPGLASGYYREPELTAKRFISNPFGDPRAPVLFRTGDLARHRPDGILEYCGRKDLQVKVRGQRVEPTEVEYWIRQYPGASDAAVVGYADAEQGAFLVAFVVSTDDARSDKDLRAFLSGQLPEWMVPRHITWVMRLPQLHSGKVDRAALRLAERGRPHDLPPLAEPATAVQRRLRRLWRTVLQLPEVGVEDQFTRLGGDSLRVLLLRSAIQDEFGRLIDLADLMGAQTILAQEALLDGSVSAGPIRSQPARVLTAVASERAKRAALRATQTATPDRSGQ